jgi:4-carboxymuconolactone decarboxylase
VLGDLRAIGDFAPKLGLLTDDLLFGDVWQRDELPKRDRSPITSRRPHRRRRHRAAAEPSRAGQTNGLTELELKEMIIHLAFYAGPAPCPPSKCQGSLRRLTNGTNLCARIPSTLLARPRPRRT